MGEIIVSASNAQQSYRWLRSRIMMGQFEPGERIIIDRITERLGISLTPVRESLRMLEKEGLVQSTKNHGFAVVNVTREEMVEMFEVRQTLEGLAARLAAQNATVSELKSIERCLRSMERLSIANDELAYFEKDMKFHSAIAAAAHNRTLAQMIEGIIAKKRAFYFTAFGDYGGELLKRNAEHQQIANAIVCRDAENAERLMQLHIDRALSSMVAGK